MTFAGTMNDDSSFGLTRVEEEIPGDATARCLDCGLPMPRGPCDPVECFSCDGWFCSLVCRRRHACRDRLGKLVFAASLPRAKPPSGLVQLWEQGFAGRVLGLVPLTPTLVALPVWTERSRFHETVALTQYLLGMDHSETLASRRVSGSASNSFERKRLLLQRDLWTCPMVHLLEPIVLKDVPDASTEDRIVVGHALFLVFARAMHKTPDMIEQHKLLTHVAKEIDAGRIRTTVSQVLTPINAANMREAHRLVETGKAKGKIVVEGF